MTGSSPYNEHFFQNTIKYRGRNIYISYITYPKLTKENLLACQPKSKVDFVLKTNKIKSGGLKCTMIKMKKDKGHIFSIYSSE